MAKKKTNHLQDIKALSKRKDILPDVKLPKKKKAKRKRRNKKNNMAEKHLEQRIILALRMRQGVTVSKSGEDSVYNKKYVLAGMSDLMVFVVGCGVMFMEVKTLKGKQRETQVAFEAMCALCGIYYCLVRSVSQAHREVDYFEKNRRCD